MCPGPYRPPVKYPGHAKAYEAAHASEAAAHLRDEPALYNTVGYGRDRKRDRDEPQLLSADEEFLVVIVSAVLTILSGTFGAALVGFLIGAPWWKTPLEVGYVLVGMVAFGFGIYWLGRKIVTKIISPWLKRRFEG